MDGHAIIASNYQTVPKHLIDIWTIESSHQGLPLYGNRFPTAQVRSYPGSSSIISYRIFASPLPTATPQLMWLPTIRLMAETYPWEMVINSH